MIKLAVTFSSLLLLCSCATTHPRLPADVPMNKDAARGNGLTVTLRLKSGEELLFAVDTAAPCTVLDKSLEPKLGRPLESQPIPMNSWGRKQTEFNARSPNLASGNLPAASQFLEKKRKIQLAWLISHNLTEFVEKLA